MKPQITLTLSLASISVLLLMSLIPTESSTAGWVCYGVIIGLLLGIAIKSANDLVAQASYQRIKRNYYNRSR